MDVDIRNEELGVKAIIALQSCAGIRETPEQAKRGWASMSNNEKRQTLLAHRALFGGS
jgi:hypothetical protein